MDEFQYASIYTPIKSDRLVLMNTQLINILILPFIIILTLFRSSMAHNAQNNSILKPRIEYKTENFSVTMNMKPLAQMPNLNLK